jgi:glycine betaine/choline ABC-type transport system substrate-binding protein/ABC-type proline/glycine betaine transport system permease subunit
MIDAIKFIFQSRDSLAGGTRIGGSELWPLLWTHLRVTFESVLIACLVALPVAMWLGHRGKGQLAASTAANVGRAVPSFAVLVFFSTYFGLNITNLVFAMVLLALPPIFVNTYVGIRQVDPDVVDAARGMGMSERTLATRVEVPLALPLIFGGIRTSTVNVLATATLGPYVGVDTLGVPIINANVHGDAGRLGTAILIAFLAIVAELLFAALQRAVTPRGLKLSRSSTPHRRNAQMRSRTVVTALALLVLAVFGLAACGGDDNNDNSSSGNTTTGANGAATANVIKNDPANGQTPTLTVGSKNFTEEFILGQIYSQALKAAGFKVKNQFNLGSEQIALKAVKSNKVGMYPEYTGTVLTSFCKVPTDKVPTDPDQAYEQAKTCMAKQNIVALPRTPYTNSNGFAVTQDTAQKLGGITKLSDLKGKSEKLTVSGPPECQQRTDCLLGLEKVYGLKFKKFLSIDLAKRHEVLKNGQTDVGEVFTTDGQIKAENFVLLQDDKQLFPPYNATLLVRKDVADAAGPNFAKTIELVQKGLTTEVMQELNSRVDLDKESPAAVAKEYLQEAGYLQ